MEAVAATDLVVGTTAVTEAGEGTIPIAVTTTITTEGEKMSADAIGRKSEGTSASIITVITDGHALRRLIIPLRRDTIPRTEGMTIVRQGSLRVSRSAVRTNVVAVAKIFERLRVLAVLDGSYQ